MAINPQWSQLKVLIPSKIKQFKWISILSKKKVEANSHHFFSVKNNKIFTHIKFNIFPDGGVARLRLYGSITKSKALKNKKMNLASLLDGASVVACNNEHFGKAENILAPGKAKNMGDGWETRRRREPGFDWLLIALGAVGEAHRIEVDTSFYKGNSPAKCSVQGNMPNIMGSAMYIAVIMTIHFRIRFSIKRAFICLLASNRV